MDNKVVYHIHLSVPGIYENKGISRGFQRAGYEVHILDWQKAKARFGIKRLREQIIEDVREICPRFVFAQVQTKGILDRDTINKVMDVCPMILFTVDARNEEESEWMYDLNRSVKHFFYSNWTDVHRAFDRGIHNCSVIQSSCDEDQYRIINRVDPEVPPIVFIGNRTSKYPLSAQRERMVEQLQKEFGSDFRAYGLGFSDGFIKPEREVVIYNSAKVCICHNQFDYKLYQSDRLWRILACGGTPVIYNPLYLSMIKSSLEHRNESSKDGNRDFFMSHNTYYHRVKEMEKKLFRNSVFQ